MYICLSCRVSEKKYILIYVVNNLSPCQGPSLTFNQIFTNFHRATIRTFHLNSQNSDWRNYRTWKVKSVFNLFSMLVFMSRYVTVLGYRDKKSKTYNQRAKINAKSNKLSPRDWISKHTKNGIFEKCSRVDRSRSGETGVQWTPRSCSANRFSHLIPCSLNSTFPDL